MDSATIRPGTRRKLKSLRVQFNQGTAEDTALIGASLRPLDAAVVRKLGLPAGKLVAYSHSVSTEVWTLRCLETGDRLAVLGIGPKFTVGESTMLGMWLFGTKGLDRVLRRSVRGTLQAARLIVQDIVAKHGRVGNILTANVKKSCLPFIRALGGRGFALKNKDILWWIG